MRLFLDDFKKKLITVPPLIFSFSENSAYSAECCCCFLVLHVKDSLFIFNLIQHT